MLRTVSGLMLALLMVPFALGEERFYPIVGPDGRMQLIRSDTTPDSQPAPSKPEAAVAPLPPAKGSSSEPVEPSPAAAPPSAGVGAASEGVSKARLPHAAYDSGEYVDSEAVEAAAAPADDKKRFYLIDDGMGARVSESGGDKEEGGLAPPTASPAAVESGNWLPLAVARRAWTPAEAMRDMPWLPACAAPAMLERFTALVAGEPAVQVVAEADYAFLPATRVLGVYRLAGEGPRTLVMRSYARKIRQPAFLHPRLGFLDAKGCLTRVTHDYFERNYPATDRRHAYLRADLVVHTGEEWLLLLAPSDNDKAAAALPWRESGFGQLKFTLKK